VWYALEDGNAPTNRNAPHKDAWISATVSELDQKNDSSTETDI
jgi:hypothetical protein